MISQDRFNGASWVSSFYGYDGHNNVRYLTDVSGNVTDTYDYDAFGNLTARTSISGLPTPNSYLFTGEQYDADLGLYYLRARYQNTDTGRFWTQDSFEGIGADPLSLHKYTYCGNNPVNEVDQSGHPSTINRVYTYDSIYRLTGETINGTPSTGSASYDYDPVGNRLSRTTLGSGLGTLGSTAATFDANDRLNSDTYDANGNTLLGSGFGQSLPDEYDFENRLVTRHTSSATVRITYDGDGNRVSKTLTTSTNSVTTYYVVDELNPSGYAQVLEERVSLNSQPSALNCVYTYGHALISQDRFNGASWVSSFYGYDGHNNVRYLTDVSGNVTDTYDYDAFGNLTARTSIGTPTLNSYLFTGEQYDADLGLYYLRARYQNTDTGRFWTQDSFEGFGSDPSSLHKYTYCQNNPISAYDRSGHLSIAEVGAAAGIGSALSIPYTYFASNGTATWDQYVVNIGIGAITGVGLAVGGEFLAAFGTGGKIAAFALGSCWGIASIEEAAENGNPALVLFNTFTLGLFAIPGGLYLTRDYQNFYLQLAADERFTEGSGFVIKGSKWRFFFGKASADGHNTPRTEQNVKDLETLDIKESEGGREKLMEVFEKGLSGEEIHRVTRHDGISILRRVEISDIGAIDVTYYYPEGNLTAHPQVTSIRPKIYKQ